MPKTCFFFFFYVALDEKLKINITHVAKKVADPKFTF